MSNEFKSGFYSGVAYLVGAILVAALIVLSLEWCKQDIMRYWADNQVVKRQARSMGLSEHQAHMLTYDEESREQLIAAAVRVGREQTAGK